MTSTAAKTTNTTVTCPRCCLLGDRKRLRILLEGPQYTATSPRFETNRQLKWRLRTPLDYRAGQERPDRTALQRTRPADAPSLLVEGRVPRRLLWVRHGNSCSGDPGWPLRSLMPRPVRQRLTAIVWRRGPRCGLWKSVCSRLLRAGRQPQQRKEVWPSSVSESPDPPHCCLVRRLLCAAKVART